MVKSVIWIGRSGGCPSVVVTVSVRSRCNVSTSPWRCTMRWCSQHNLTRLFNLVLPPLDRSIT